MAYLDIELGDDRPVVSIVSSFSEIPQHVEALVDALNNLPLGIQVWELHPTSAGERSESQLKTIYSDHVELSSAHVIVAGSGFADPELELPFDPTPVELQYLRYWHRRALDRSVPFAAALWARSHGGTHRSAKYARLRKDLERHQWCTKFETPLQLCTGVAGSLIAVLDGREFDFDVAISFAGQDRLVARNLAAALRQRGLRVFFDEYVTAELLGADLTSYFGDVFERRARFCIMLSSEAYVGSAWATLERQHAQNRQLREAEGYILQVRLDDTAVPGVPGTIGYVNYTSPEEVAGLIETRVRAGGRPTNRLHRAREARR